MSEFLYGISDTTPETFGLYVAHFIKTGQAPQKEVTCIDGRRLTEEIKKYKLSQMPYFQGIKIECSPNVPKEKIATEYMQRHGRSDIPHHIIAAIGFNHFLGTPAVMLASKLEVVCDGVYSNEFRCGRIIKLQVMRGFDGYLCPAVCGYCAELEIASYKAMLEKRRQDRISEQLNKEQNKITRKDNRAGTI